jgi:ketosteroid isomerase-like protein
MKNLLVKTATTFLVSFIIVLYGYSQSNDELKAKIEKIDKEMAAAMVEGNSEKSLSYYTADAVSMPNYGKLSEGIEAIKKSNADMMASGMKVKAFETTILKIIPSGNIITEIGTYKFSYTMSGMDTPMDDYGKYLTIWEKQKDGSLKVKVEIWNADSYPSQKM